jgi:hypothetical protein
MKNIPYKTACSNGLPDEYMMFETCRRHQKLNYIINLKSVHSWYIIVSQCMVQKIITKYYCVSWLK